MRFQNCSDDLLPKLDILTFKSSERFDLIAQISLGKYPLTG